MVGIIIGLLLGALNSSADTPQGFDAPAPSKLSCRISGVNLAIGAHYGQCSGKGGSRYFVRVLGIGTALGLNAGFLKLKSLDGPFREIERIDGNRYGAEFVIGGQLLRGNRYDAKDRHSDRVRGTLIGVGLGFTWDRIRIKLIRLR